MNSRPTPWRIRPMSADAGDAVRLDRRDLLRAGGITFALGSLVAACGGETLGSDGPGRIGTAEPIPTFPDSPINDLVLLRTAQSLEQTALDVYAAAAATEALSAQQLELVEAITADHAEHMDALGEVITAAGGSEYRCANPFITARVVTPVLGALENSRDLTSDLLRVAYSIENLAASTYQLFIAFLTEPELRGAALTIGADEARHTAALAIALTGSPTGYVSPVVLGQEAEPDAAGLPVVYAVPGRFSEVSARELVLDSPDAEGGLFSINVQTPAENSYVYEYMEC